LLISEVAALASYPQHDSDRKTIVQRFDAFGKMYVKPLGGISSSDEESGRGEDVAPMANQFMSKSSNGKSPNNRFSAIAGSIEGEIAEMLDEWEEPDLRQENLRVSGGPFSSSIITCRFCQFESLIIAPYCAIVCQNNRRFVLSPSSRVHRQ
jgi:hypothetical protein